MIELTFASKGGHEIPTQKRVGKITFIRGFLLKNLNLNLPSPAWYRSKRKGYLTERWRSLGYVKSKVPSNGWLYGQPSRRVFMGITEK
ncbi:hypothetical protein SLE2022_403840 [Rubroshorea leprosula]|uniref:Uncharacterized protein n=1 Tax=Rubroshorea leprosula TaxID=152421 RepID=A0AAV5MTE5_9ROSI|nr:hypothetical protein SLEP1_g58590 [Rubroshorea leprosula]GKV52254.1 hypothetical protein SLEP1_g58843 [Rubroshorea leprosula]